MRQNRRSLGGQGISKGGDAMKILILSDGTARGTQVLSPATNEKIEDITAIEWSIDAESGKAKAKISLTDVPVYVEAEEIKTDPPSAVILKVPEKYTGA